MFNKLAAIALASLVLPAAAQAGIFLTPQVATGEIATPGVKSYTFNASASTGTIDFTLIGYRTLDGFNCCTDTLTVDLNGTTLFSGAFNLGGGGTNTIFASLNPVSITNYVSGSPVAYNGTALGGSVDLSTAASFWAGSNTLTFTYTGSNQGTADEAWGLNGVTASGATVPEPQTWALLVAGFGLVGVATRRRRVVGTVAA